MRRSDMIIELYSLLYNSKNINVPTSSYINEQKLAEEILAFIEERGMLPPTSTCQIVEDELRPGFHKHGPVGHWWDEE
jgi:hypothetical protein